jgi:hypothetical protein
MKLPVRTSLKKAKVALLASTVLFSSISTVLADTGSNAGDTGSNSSTFTLSNPLGPNVTVSGIILTFMQIASYIAVLFGVIMLVWVGLQFILARGNSERMKELSKWLLYIVVGVAVILGARILISVIINTLQATGTVNPSVIQNAQNALNSH